ncbi:hypothetical protein GOP47_0025402 [Adiantum capillus-veneris]|uniref:Uncharacterized protein n=1 Tax=Adiantum capillus-veneris TaxID=13818 RepID=A0A9D4U0K3_ADICA|nr:hypothetical protein GOP47_0025402 [Adiantum capillus-veneris]
MASPACHKLPALSRITPDRRRTHHTTVLPFPPPMDAPLACTNFPHSMLIFPSPASPANVPFVRNAFEDAVCDSLADNDEDDTSSSSASSSSECLPAQEGPLDSLASLCAALPIKRGLSRYFSGKSQSFSSLGRVSSVEELAKPENPYVKRRRTAVLGALKHHSYPPRCSSSAGISKRLATGSRFKGHKSNIPCPDGVLLEGLAKCFSVPEF